MSTLLITIVPSILILLFFFLSDKFKEPKKTIALVFFLGILICLPAGIINTFVENMLSKESLILRDEISRINPDILLKQEVDIGGDSTEVDIPMTVEFFWPKSGI